MVPISAQIDMILETDIISLETDIIRNAVTIAYIINEVISIRENATAMGLPLEAWEKKYSNKKVQK